MKLSELKNDEKICVGGIENIMEKQDYLFDIEEYKGKPVYLAEKVQVYFSLSDAIENQIEDEVYEDCVNDVMYDLDNRSTMNTKEIEKIINDAIENNPSYEQGAEIEIDV